MNCIRLKLLFFLIFYGLYCDMFAQTDHGLTIQQMDSIVNPSVLNDADRIIRFDKVVYDIGTITEDDSTVNVDFEYCNVGNKSFIINKVSTNCGCTLSDYEAKLVKPGETGIVSLNYVPKNHPGTVDTNAFVYIDGEEKFPVAKLTLIGHVLPGKDIWSRFKYSMGKLRLKRKSIVFDEVKKNQMPSERILCGNSGTTPIKLSSVVKPSFVSFYTEPEVIEPGCEADIVIVIDETKIPSVKGEDFSFPIIIDGIDGKPSERIINVRVKRDK